MAKSSTYIYSLGRRKSATARVKLFGGGSGEITINDQPAIEYFDGSQALIETLKQPLKLLDLDGRYNIFLKVKGGGVSGQAEACRHAISKALSLNDEAIRGTLKKAGFMKRDPREKERKKPGLRRARKQEQFSKR